MREFAEAFLLVFAQLAVGGLFALSIPPFQQLERGFYKSTAAVYFFAALIAILGWLYLLVTHDVGSGAAWTRGLELSIWSLFGVLVAVYLRSLWGDAYRLRARSYLFALLFGIVALSASAWRYRPPTVLAAVLYPLDFAASASVLGTAATGMLLGHWYLIDVGLTLTPFRKMYRTFVACIHLEVAMLLLSVVLLWGLAGPPARTALEKLWNEHVLLLGLRVALGPVACYALAWMIRRTLDVPQTMAATGLFYVALLATVVGEILGRTILFRTALPL